MLYHFNFVYVISWPLFLWDGWNYENQKPLRKNNSFFKKDFDICDVTAQNQALVATC